MRGLGGVREAGSGQDGQQRLRQPPTGRTAGPAPTLADRWRPKPTRSTVLPVGAARHGLVWFFWFWAGKGHAAQRSGPCALETKFLRFDAGQERDGVLSLFAFGWLFPPWGWFWSPPSRRSRRSRCRGSVCCRRFLCGPSRAVGSSQAWGVTLRALPGRTMSGRFPAPTCPAFVPRP